jgi:hypothetical protein
LLSVHSGAGQAQAGLPYSLSTRRRCSSRISSVMSVLDNRTSSAKGAFGRQPRQDSAGMRLVTAARRFEISAGARSRVAVI